MRLLFIITGSIAVSKSHEILEKIKQKKSKTNCAKKILSAVNQLKNNYEI